MIHLDTYIQCNSPCFVLVITSFIVADLWLDETVLLVYNESHFSQSILECFHMKAIDFSFSSSSFLLVVATAVGNGLNVSWHQSLPG